MLTDPYNQCQLFPCPEPTLPEPLVVVGSYPHSILPTVTPLSSLLFPSQSGHFFHYTHYLFPDPTTCSSPLQNNQSASVELLLAWASTSGDQGIYAHMLLHQKHKGEPHPTCSCTTFLLVPCLGCILKGLGFSNKLQCALPLASTW